MKDPTRGHKFRSKVRSPWCRTKSPIRHIWVLARDRVVTIAVVFLLRKSSQKGNLSRTSTSSVWLNFGRSRATSISLRIFPFLPLTLCWTLPVTKLTLLRFHSAIAGPRTSVSRSCDASRSQLSLSSSRKSSFCTYGTRPYVGCAKDPLALI